MIDQKLLRNNPRLLAFKLYKRGFEVSVVYIEAYERDRKFVQTKLEVIRAQMNSNAKLIADNKKSGLSILGLVQKGSELRKEAEEQEKILQGIDNLFQEYVSTIPNLPHETTPIGKTEKDNVVIQMIGDIPQFDFKIKNHLELTNNIDQSKAAEITGSRFTLMTGIIAKLNRALVQFMLDKHINEHNYFEVNVPVIVNEDSLKGTGQLPKFEVDLFEVKHHINSKRYFLTPTAEVPLTNIVRDTLFSDNTKLPLKFVSHSLCFRSEAGASGKDTRGLMRQHQFEKVELVQITTPNTSIEALKNMLIEASSILDALELPYRIVRLCTGDLGFASAATYDLEVWVPSENTYREISSISLCTDFQSRNLRTRYKNSEGNNELVHTLNASGLAVGRTLLALMENHQQIDGSIRIPKALQPYMNNMEVIK